MDIGGSVVPYPAPSAAIVPGLCGVSETMLWSLHNRACEARRDGGVLHDPMAISIHDAIDYDFEHHFGLPRGSLAARAAQIDAALRVWLTQHPHGFVVSLGEGLETQCARVDNGTMRWLSVDLADAISLRERFIAPTARFMHAPVSALSPAWMDYVDPADGVCIVAQGLLMYLAPELVEGLFAGLASRFPGAVIIFDTVPRWFSQLTMTGLQQTPHYRLPAMPWGINRDEVAATLQSWHVGLSEVEFLDYRAPRGLHRGIADAVRHVPVLRHNVPCLVKVKVKEALLF